MDKKKVIIIIIVFIASWVRAQNLVPNPSFENMDDCGPIQPDIACLLFWAGLMPFDGTNTPDLGYEGAVFFPPSTIDAYDGNQYLNIECSTGNPEYIQVQLLQAMTEGTSYCVSFYASVTQESPEVAPSLGAYFTDMPLNDSPFDLGIVASVQGPVDFDPTAWTLVTGTYVAQGGENIMVLAGFENTGTMPFPYMYIDMVSVIPMPALTLNDVELCDESVVLDASFMGATYQWNTGAASSAIEVTTIGEYTVTRTLGTCSQTATAEVLECDTDIDITDPEHTLDNDTIVPPPITPDEPTLAWTDYHFYIPNAFTPDGDGVNDVFGVVGPETDFFHLQIFNRWGQVVYDSQDINHRWTGNHLSGNYFVPDGIYTYQIKATDGMLVFEEKGHLTLMR